MHAWPSASFHFSWRSCSTLFLMAIYFSFCFLSATCYLPALTESVSPTPNLKFWVLFETIMSLKLSWMMVTFDEKNVVVCSCCTEIIYWFQLDSIWSLKFEVWSLKFEVWSWFKLKWIDFRLHSGLNLDFKLTSNWLQIEVAPKNEKTNSLLPLISNFKLNNYFWSRLVVKPSVCDAAFLNPS